MASKRQLDLVAASAARAAAGASAAYDGQVFDGAIAYIDVTAFTSGTMTPVIQGSPDEGATWFPIATGTGITGTGQYVVQTNGPIPRLLRLAWTGTFSLTFSARLERIRRGL